MSTFSERHGYKTVRDALQVEAVDEDLRIGLWNVVSVAVLPEVGEIRWIEPGMDIDRLMTALWLRHYKLALDSRTQDWKETYWFIRNKFFGCSWFEVYDFVEFLAKTSALSESDRATFIELCNATLEREMAGYRILSGKVVPITRTEEVEAVEAAFNAVSSIRTVDEHLRRSLSLLSDRTEPDYRNAIKEAISGVEALCVMINGDSSATWVKH